MASGAAKAANADIAIAISGIAGPGGGALDKPVGLVWFCIHFAGKNYPSEQVFSEIELKLDCKLLFIH